MNQKINKTRNMKPVTRNSLTILERELNELYETHKIAIPKEAFPYIRRAMKSFAINAIQENRRNSRKEMVKRLKYVPKTFRLAYREFFIQWIRKRFLKLAVKTAELRAFNEGYKMYVVRATTFSYKVFSTLEFKHNKKVKVLKKNLTAKDVEREAARVIKYEKNNNLSHMQRRRNRISSQQRG